LGSGSGLVGAFSLSLAARGLPQTAKTARTADSAIRITQFETSFERRQETIDG
jgi:hypothetical protein